MAEIGYDTLTITINADSKQAISDINKLNRGLTNLDKTAKDINTRRIGEVKGLLLNIAKIDFSNVSKGLQDVVSAFKYFQSKTAQKVSPIINPKDFDKQIKSYQNVLGKDFNFSFLSGGNTTTSELDKQIEKAQSLVDIIKDLKLTTSQTNTIFQTLGININKISDEKLKSVEEALRKAGKSSQEIGKVIKALTEEMNDLKESTGQTNRSFAKMLKNIMRYRVVRRIIQEIFTQITNAFSELANVDEDFNQAFGEIKSAISYIARVLASVIAPIIKVIAPIITMLAEAIGEIGNALGSSLAGALGQEQFAQAEENVESYTESLNKAKSVRTGIDELNVIGKDENESNFSMVDTNGLGKLGDFFKELKDGLQPILGELVGQLSQIMTTFIGALENAEPLLELIVDLINDFVSYTDDGVNGSLKSTIEALGIILKSLGLILQLLKPILDIVNVIGALALNFINWSIELISTGLASFFDLISTLGEIIIALFDGDFKKIGELWNNLMERMTKRWSDFGKNIGNFFIKIWNKIIEKIESGLQKIVDGYNKVASALGWKTLGDVNLSGIKGQTFATGGFPEDGIFFANSNELVGRFDNGRTAVANNEQIINGIKQGVKEAILESNNGNAKIYIDGVEVANIIEKRIRNRGQTLVYGGGINYGK